VSRRALVAGIGNVFLGDDGFGVEVAARLSSAPLPAGVRVRDAGIRARDLAYELVDGRYETAILVDAVARGGAPGTLYVIEPDAESMPRPASMAAVDGHAMNPESTLALVEALGGVATRILIVGCEPASVHEGIGLSEPVAAAVDEAIGVIRELLCA
jgi:hydrogenase maturation protease